MAMCIPGSLVADVRGSVGTETFSRTFAGLVVKTRSNPAQPESAKRDAAQAILTSVSQGWSDRLTAPQRNAWRTYGARYPRPNRWGNPVLDSGYLAYVRCNCSLKIINDTWWIDVPPELGMMPMCPFTCTCFFDDPSYLLDIVPDPNYPFIYYDYLIISVGKQSNVGVSYYSSPWQILQTSLRWNESWGPELTEITLPGWVGTGDRTWVKLYVFRKPDGRLSVPFQNSCVVS